MAGHTGWEHEEPRKDMRPQGGVKASGQQNLSLEGPNRSMRHTNSGDKSQTGRKSLERGRQVPAGDINLGVGIWMTFEAANA